MATAETPETPAFHHTASLEEQRIAKVYAEALLNAAEEKGVVDEVQEELRELVEGVFDQDPQFEEFLASGAISKGHKEQVLDSAFKERTSDILFNFLGVLNEHDRLSILRTVYLVYQRLNNQRKRRIPVRVTTAYPLTEDQTNRLLDFLRSRLKLEPILETDIEKDILGGMIIQVADFVFDRSVRSELLNIRKQLMARSSYEIQSGRNRFGN